MGIRNRGALRVLWQVGLLLLAAHPVLSAPDAPAAKTVKPGGKAPDFTLRDTAGKTWQLSKLRGKAVLLDFGRVTCIACQGIAGELQRFHAAYTKQAWQAPRVWVERQAAATHSPLTLFTPGGYNGVSSIVIEVLKETKWRQTSS